MDSHKLRSILFSTLLLVFCMGTESLLAQKKAAPGDLSLGSIHFPTSAEGEAQKEFLTGVLALHSFWYPEARHHFQKAQELNPKFALAYWGEAMTYDHPLWEQHDQKKGADVLEKLNQQISTGNVIWTDREKGYVNAVRILYNSELELDERRRKYKAAMQQLRKHYNNDDEALAFAALSSMSAPGFNYDNPEVRDVVPIAAKLEDLYQRKPNHPGAIHYLIHLYDSDKFAELGLRPARDYAQIAYSSSHAIHMPSHIYKRLEKWNKVINSNIKAYKASVEWQKTSDRPLKDRDFHAYRWLFEAYLEIDNYSKACNMIKEMRRLEKEARERGENLGRIPGTLQNFRKQYSNKAGKSAPKCGKEL